MLRTLFIGAACLVPFLLSPADALGFSSAGSGAYGSRINFNIAGAAVANATTAPVSGTATPAYDQSGSLASITQNFTLTSGVLGTAVQGLQTGLVSTRAYSNAPGVTSATGMVTLANVNSLLTSKLLTDIVPLAALGLAADSISSTTTAGIDANGALFSSGSSTIANLGLTGSVLGALTINGSLYSNPAANTVILSLAGLVVTLNEQLTSQTTSGLFAQTNAVHIAFNNYSIAGKLLSGDMILGHSEAQVMGAVPEPATWAMMLVGFGIVGFSLRARRPGMAFV